MNRIIPVLIAALFMISCKNNKTSEPANAVLMQDTFKMNSINISADTGISHHVNTTPATVNTGVEITKPPILPRKSATTKSSLTTNSGTATNTSVPVATETPVKKKGWSKAAKGAVIGAGSGAVGGAIIAGDGNRVKGAIIGSAVGAAGGYIIGKSQDKKDGRP